MRSFYNTIHASGAQLELFEQEAKTQETAVLDFFRANPFQDFTPCEVQTIMNTAAPITSIRRAITNLTKQGRLYKTGNMRPGQYGKPNYTWRYND